MLSFDSSVTAALGSVDFNLSWASAMKSLNFPNTSTRFSVGKNGSKRKYAEFHPAEFSKYVRLLMGISGKHRLCKSTHKIGIRFLLGLKADFVLFQFPLLAH